MSEKVQKSEQEWRAQLTPEQYHVTREKGTEGAFTGEYNDCKTSGTYACVCCGEELFSSDAKLDSGTGWPSFFQPLSPSAVAEATDGSYGMVRTDHILFIAAGAFHASKPSDLIPELQGRFPIRVELKSLNQEDFKRILTEPQNALARQYISMMETEGVQITITNDAIDEIAVLAFKVNESVEDIGARRLHTIMEKLFEEFSFEAPNLEEKEITIDETYVREQLSDIVKDQDLSKYIL